MVLVAVLLKQKEKNKKKTDSCYVCFQVIAICGSYVYQYGENLAYPTMAADRKFKEQRCM